MRRRRKPPSNNARDGLPISADELREIVDRWLHGESMKAIARSLQREPTAIEEILFSKVPRDYTEEGKRESPVFKLSMATSSLNLQRQPTRRDIAYFARLRSPSHRRSIEECCIILHLSRERVEEMRAKYGLKKQATLTDRLVKEY